MNFVATLLLSLFVFGLVSSVSSQMSIANDYHKCDQWAIYGRLDPSTPRHPTRGFPDITAACPNIVFDDFVYHVGMFTHTVEETASAINFVQKAFPGNVEFGPINAIQNSANYCGRQVSYNINAYIEPTAFAANSSKAFLEVTQVVDIHSESFYANWYNAHGQGRVYDAMRTPSSCADVIHCFQDILGILVFFGPLPVETTPIYIATFFIRDPQWGVWEILCGA